MHSCIHIQVMPLRDCKKKKKEERICTNTLYCAIKEHLVTDANGQNDFRNIKS